MTTPRAADIAYVPGRLSFGPSSLVAPYPHGGTALGIVRAIAARPNILHHAIEAEEYGGETVEYVSARDGAWTLAAILRSYDDDAVSKLFPNTSIGTVSQRRLVSQPGAVRTGRLMSGSSIVLVFTPDSSDERMLVLHRAIPMVEEAVLLTMAQAIPLEVGVVFAGIRNAAGKSASWGMREDIAL